MKTKQTESNMTTTTTVKKIKLEVLTEGFLVTVKSDVPCDCGDEECTLTDTLNRRFAFADFKSAVTKIYEFEQHAQNLQTKRQTENAEELN